MPFNPVSGRNYRGMNALWLMCAAEASGFSDPRWMPHRQSASLGAQLRKGEQGSVIQYWKWHEEHPLRDENGRRVLDDKGQPVLERGDLQRPRVFSAVVFNAGRLAAEKAAKAVGGAVVLPRFAADDPSSDWNDVAVRQGKEACRNEWRTAFDLAAQQLKLHQAQDLPQRSQQEPLDQSRE